MIGLNDGLNRVKNTRDGENRPKSIPFIGKMVAGEEGKELGEKIDKAVSIVNATKSAENVAEGVSTGAPKIMDAIDTLKVFNEEITKDNN